MPSTSLTLDRFVLASAVVLTCVLFTRDAADPVNVIKVTALALCALWCVGSGCYRAARFRSVVAPHRAVLVVVSLLTVALVVATLVAPVTGTAVIGAYGRNSGLLAYGSALVLFLTALRAFGRPHTQVLVGGVVFAGLFTALYGLLQRIGVDAVPWNNPFNPVIAALGNPNFASGYLGIAASVAAGGAFWTRWGPGWRVLSACTAALCLLAAALSSSVQGPIAAAAGLLVVAVAWSSELPAPRRRVWLGALVSVTAVGLLTLVVGAVAKVGPAAGIFSDAGSRARAFYWRAGIEMFTDEPVVGVGLDQYGAFWRSARSLESVAALGGGSYSDAAHSVPLQMLAQGGLLLGAAYAAFLGVTLLALVRGLWRLRGADRMLLASVGAGWAAYQVQSLVSIDQVPLIVLHFALAGAVIVTSDAFPGYELRLPGAPRPVQPHRNDVRAKRRAAVAAPRARDMSAGDLVIVSAVGVLLCVGAWQALSPLRANLAAGEGDRILAQGDGNAALAAYERAVALVPGQAVYWKKQAALFSQVQLPARARVAYDKAADVDPYDVGALRGAAELAEKEGDLPTAAKMYQRLLRVDLYSAESLVLAAMYGLRHQDAAGARRLLENGAEDLPPDATLLAVLGDARAVTGDAGAAREAYNAALALDPAQATALSGLKKLDAT